MSSPSAILSGARERFPGLDHAIRAVGRYLADSGDRQAASVTFFGFLSFFPLLALAASLLALFLGDEAVGTVVREVNSYAPGLAEQLDLETILQRNTKAGITGLLGLLGLLYTGLGWVDALREAIRVIWHHNVQAGNFLVKKAKDVFILAGLGLTVVLSVAVSAATGAFSGFALDLIGLEETFAAVALAKVVGVALGVLTSTGLFLFLFIRLPKVQSPFRRAFRAALLAAVLFELLKRVGAIYIERTTDNPLYGAFAVIVGLLVWINIVSRMLLLCAAWAVTAPYDSDVAPSGTASVDLALQAGIAPELADQDEPRTSAARPPAGAAAAGTAATGAAAAESAAPGPAATGSAAAGSAAAESAATGSAAIGSAAIGSAATGAPAPGGSALTADPQSRAEVLVRKAAQFTAGAMGMALMAVLIYVGRTLKGLVRR